MSRSDSVVASASRRHRHGDPLLGDSFELLPTLPRVGATDTDPRYGIGYTYRSCDDSSAEYSSFMRRLVPELVRVTGDDPCFVWQSQLHIVRWHEFLPAGFSVLSS